MKGKRIASFVLSLIMCLLIIPFSASAESTVALDFSSSAEGKDEVLLGEKITYTVGVTENENGFIGTLYFEASDNLEYVSATLMGQNFEAKKVAKGEYAGAYAIYFVGELYDNTTENFCTITFKVINDGETEVTLIPYELTNGNSMLTATVTNSAQSVPVEELSKPIITTEEIPEGVMGYEYSVKLVANRSEFLKFRIVSGDLPEGLTMADDGTISGIPAEFGEFTIKVRVRLLSKLDSDAATYVLSILEKPRKLELSEESKYTVDENDYLLGVTDKTSLESLLNSFKNAEHIKVHNGKGNEVTSSSELVGTGYTVSLMHGDEIVHKITVVVKGDTSGDGKIGTLDYQRIRAHYLKNFTLEGAYLMAGKVSDRPNIGTLDYQRVRAHYLGNFDLFA